MHTVCCTNKDEQPKAEPETEPETARPPKHCVGTDGRCQHADEATCLQLIEWRASCHQSESGLLDESLDPSVCSPLCMQVCPLTKVELAQLAA